MLSSRTDETNYDAIIENPNPSIGKFGDALRQASRFGNVHQFKRLIDWGVPLFGIIAVNWRENGGFSALDCAAANGHEEIVRVLAKLGGSQLSNTPDDYSGMTPLLWAAQGGHWRCIEALCENYSQLDVTDRNGQTALHIACRELHYDLARVLLEHSCNPNIKDASLGKTPLHMVAGLGNYEMAELLVTRGADVNIVDNDGNTPIYIAAQEGHKELREMLLGYNRDQPHLSPGLAARGDISGSPVSPMQGQFPPSTQLE